MKFEVFISDRANETFDYIREQLESKWSDKIALEFEQKVVRILDLIKISPFMFKALSQNENIRKALIHKNCSMFYEIKGHAIIILFFWDNRQDPIFL